MLKRLLALIALATGLISYAYGQTYPGQLPANTVLGNSSGSPVPFAVPGQIVNGQMANAPANSVKCNATASPAGPQDCSYLVVYAKDHGVKCDGITDDTTAIGTADAYAATAHAVLRFPGGTCLVSSALSPSSSARWMGESFQQTIISTNSATANIVTISNSFVSIENIAFASTVTRTAGWFVDIGANQFRLKTFSMASPFEGIRIQDGTAIINIEDGTISTPVVTSGVGIRVGSGTGTGAVAVSIRFVVVQGNPASKPFAGIVLTNAGDVTLVDDQFISNTNGMDILPGNGQTVVSVHSIGTFFDSNSTNALVINPSGTGFVGRSNFTTSWFASTSAGNNINIAPGGTATVDGISFTDSENYAASGSGVSITQAAGTAVKNISFVGGRNAGNNTGININGLTSGIITGAVIGASGGFGVNTTGISLAGTITRLAINNNDLSGSTTPYTSSATGTINGNNVPWATYSPSLSCGTATITTNSAHFSQIGKTTNIELDFTITAIGSCSAASPMAFTLPTTPVNTAVLSGQETTTSNVVVICQARTLTTSMTCNGNATRAWAVNDRVQMTGVYENQ